MLLLLYCFVANLLLQDTVERIHVGKQYGDIPRGIFLVRGENMVLCGEIVSSRETETESEREGEREREKERESLLICTWHMSLLFLSLNVRKNHLKTT